MAALAMTLLLAVTSATTQTPQPPPRSEPPLSLADVEDFLKSYVPVARIQQRIADCGVTFILDDAGERQLRAVGATDALIKLLAPPPPTPGGRWLSPIDRREMAGIAAGTFQMGSPEGEAGRDPDEAQHAVEIARPFWLDADTVTNEAYRRFVIAVPAWQKDRARFLRNWPEGSALRRDMDAALPPT